LLSSHGVGTVVMKNWEPFVPGPALAIETVNGRSCRKLREKGRTKLDDKWHEFKM
jgi:hypothetical protein